MFSVAIAVANFEALENLQKCLKALQSAKSRANVPIEFIFVMDGPNSQDFDVFVAEHVSSDDCVFLSTPTACGPCDCWNLAIAVAKFEWIVRIDCDDQVSLCVLSMFANF